MFILRAHYYGWYLHSIIFFLPARLDVKKGDTFFICKRLKLNLFYGYLSNLLVNKKEYFWHFIIVGDGTDTWYYMCAVDVGDHFVIIILPRIIETKIGHRNVYVILRDRRLRVEIASFSYNFFVG